eukprot:GHVQ01014637.1.p2 GENE.GHVQ01014637.1~~GHVQ01014637.1.p2  ORF type:complete len:120 (+),score=25.95 GHVQ01014637.1:409-768(+)
MCHKMWLQNKVHVAHITKRLPLVLGREHKNTSSNERREGEGEQGHIGTEGEEGGGCEGGGGVRATGASVFWFEKPMVGLAVVCGSAPATREFCALGGDCTVQKASGVLINGGSSFGLDA